MKTVEHKLFSINKKVKVPESTGEHVLNLFHMANLAKDLTDFKRRMERDSYFSDMSGINYNNLVYTAGRLKTTKSQDKIFTYQDDIYLQVAQYELEREGGKDAAKLQDKIGEAYEKLYDGGEED